MRPSWPHEYDLYGPQAFCPGTIYENMETLPASSLALWASQAVVRAHFRSATPTLSMMAAVDAMLVALGENADEATLIDIYRQAMEVWYNDLPVTPLNQAPALVPFNYTYWDGWPSAENPWMMPVNWWATMNLLLTGYESVETGEWVPGIRAAGQ